MFYTLLIYLVTYNFYLISVIDFYYIKEYNNLQPNTHIIPPKSWENLTMKKITYANTLFS